jgi:excisionase family DNA binding protein
MDYKTNQSDTSCFSLKPESVFIEKQLLSYKEAARYLSVSESYLRRLKSRRQISCVLVGDRGIRFRVSSLNQWIEKREVT